MLPASNVTPADQTAMTIECTTDGWFITVEQGNGDEVKTLKLTDLEYEYLGLMATQRWPHAITFKDPGR